MLELFHDIGWEYTSNFKAMVSLLFAVSSLVTMFFILYDVMVTKLIPKVKRKAFFFLALSNGSGAIYGGIRFLDALMDARYIAEHPDIHTTASQNIPLLEIPMLGMGVMTVVFLLAYNRTLHELRLHRRREDSYPDEG